MSRTFLLLFAILYCSIAYSRPPRHYFFTHYTTASGLVSYQINSMLQDKQGFIWLGTTDGLQRFDGIHYKTFQHNDMDAASLPSNIIWQILETEPGHLWLLFLDGHTGIFNTSTLHYQPVTINGERYQQGNSAFRKLIADEWGNLFLLLTGNELLQYDRSQQSFQRPTGKLFSAEMKIRAFVPERGTHRYWFATAEKGLGLYDASRDSLYDAATNTGIEPAIDLFKEKRDIEQLYIDRKKRLWTVNKQANKPVISCYNIAEQKMVIPSFQFDEKSLGFHEVSRFTEEQDGTIWVTGMQLFARFLEKEKDFELVYNGADGDHGINYVQITTLFEDREQNMWAGTANNGVFRFSPSKEFFSNFGYTSHTTGQPGRSAPCSFMPDNDGTLLVAIREDGLYRFNQNMEQVPLAIIGIPDKNKVFIWALCRDAERNIIWMGAQNGVYKYDAQKKSAVFFPLKMIGENRIRRIVSLKNGDLWMGTESGLFRWTSAEGNGRFEEGLHASALVPASRINQLMTDRKGLLWVATSGHGAYVIDPVHDSIVLHFDNKPGEKAIQLPESTAAAFYDFNDSLMVVASSTRLLLFNTKRNTIDNFSRPLSGFIASMEKDEAGFLWISTTTTLYRVNVFEKILQRFDRNDGLSNDFFMAGASYVLPDRKMLFGLYGAVVVFSPAAIVTAPRYPDLRITEVMLKDRLLNPDSLMARRVIQLGVDENALQFAVSAMSFNSGYLIKYKLDGLDNDFRNIDPDYLLHYSYIPPGNYTLLIKTFDATGKEGTKNLKLFISVAVPFWKTWWFISLLSLSFLGSLYLLDKQRIKRRLQLLAMRTDIAAGLNSDIHKALGHITVLSELASLKAENEPVKSKEFINQINIKSSQMLTAMDDILWSISPENDTISRVLERIQELVDELVNRDDCRINLTVGEIFPQTQANMQSRLDVYIMFRDAVKGLIKLGVRTMDISIGSDKEKMVYDIRYTAAEPIPVSALLEQLRHSPQSTALSASIQHIENGQVCGILVTMKPF